MKHYCLQSLLALAFALPLAARGQIPVASAPGQAALLASPDARLSANKRLVHDFWREVFEAAHMEFAENGRIAEHRDPATKQ